MQRRSHSFTRHGFVITTLIALLALSGCGLFGGEDGTPTPAAGGDTAPQVTGNNSGGQKITLVAPAPNSSVGDTISVRGAASRDPRGGNLSYRVLDADGSEIGGGEIPTGVNNGQGAPFEAQINFTPPAAGSLITLELFEQDGATGAEIAPLRLTVTYDPATGLPAITGNNLITIETPPSGTQVGSPVVITGNTNFSPFENNLVYRVFDATGTEIGSGSFTTTGEPGQPTTFNASLTFTEPAQPGNIRLEVIAPNAAGGSPIAQAGIDLSVAGSGVAGTTTTPAPPPVAPTLQQISIDTPPPGTQVGSPLVLTGRTARLPVENNLSYRVLTQDGQELGMGTITVAGEGGGPGSFVAQISFTPPAAPTTILVELLDRDPASGATLAAVTIQLLYQ